MRIGVLEQFQDPSEPAKHFITGAKAKRLVDEMRICVRLAKDKIKIVVAHSWSVIKTWLAMSAEQRRQADERKNTLQDFQRKAQANAAHPNGAEYGFSRWPSKDLRTV